MLYNVTINGQSYQLELEGSDRTWSCRLDGRSVQADAVPIKPDILSLRICAQVHEVRLERIGAETFIYVGNERFPAEVRDPRSLRGRTRAADDQGPKKLTAPMPGKVVRILTTEGEAVASGAGVLVVEAMKMQNEIKSPKKGTIRKILVRTGAAVNAGDVLAIVE